MSKKITETQFNDLVNWFKDQWEIADREGREGERTKTALRSTLGVLDIEVKRGWKDGDIVRGTIKFDDARAWYTRRGDEWVELPIHNDKAHRRYTDEQVDSFIKEGLLVEWEPKP